MNISKLKSQTMPILVAIVIALLFVVTSVHAATTLSTSIDTGGKLTVTGAIGASSTAAISGITTIYGNLNINGYATTTAASGNFATLGTLTVSGATTLAQASFAPGRYSVHWDARAASGRTLGSGVYFLRLVGDHVATQNVRVTLVR